MKKFISLFLTANLIFVQTASAGVVEDLYARTESAFDSGHVHPRARRHIYAGTAGVAIGAVAGAGIKIGGAWSLRFFTARKAARMERRMNGMHRIVSQNRTYLNGIRHLKVEPGWPGHIGFVRQGTRSALYQYKWARAKLLEALGRQSRRSQPGYIFRWAGKAALAGGLLGAVVSIAVSQPRQDEEALKQAEAGYHNPFMLILSEAVKSADLAKFESLMSHIDAGSVMGKDDWSSMLRSVVQHYLYYVKDKKKLGDYQKMIERLVEYGADLNVELGWYSSGGILHASVEREEMLRYLLTLKGIDINRRYTEGNTPLLYALKLGQWRAAEILIKAGANRCIGDFQGRIPLHYVDMADLEKDKEVAQLLRLPVSEEEETEARRVSYPYCFTPPPPPSCPSPDNR